MPSILRRTEKMRIRHRNQCKRRLEDIEVDDDGVPKHCSFLFLTNLPSKAGKTKTTLSRSRLRVRASLDSLKFDSLATLGLVDDMTTSIPVRSCKRRRAGIIDESISPKATLPKVAAFVANTPRHNPHTTSQESIEDKTTITPRIPSPIEFFPVSNSEGSLELDCTPMQRTTAGPRKEKETMNLAGVRAPTSDGLLITGSHDLVRAISSSKTASSMITPISETSTTSIRSCTAKFFYSKAPLPRSLASSNVSVAVTTHPFACKTKTTPVAYDPKNGREKPSYLPKSTTQVETQSKNHSPKGNECNLLKNEEFCMVDYEVLLPVWVSIFGLLSNTGGVQVTE